MLKINTHFTNLFLKASALILIISVVLSCTGNNDDVLIEDTELVLGTFCTIKIWGGSNQDLLEGSFEILENIENWMSPGLAGSDLYKLKEQAGQTPVIVHEDTMHVILQALRYYKISEGFLDISIGPLVSLWDINSEDPRVPPQNGIEQALAGMGLNEVEVNAEDNTVFLPRAGMALDLGAIAKGFASDQIAEYLRNKGIKKAIINLGGNIYVLGRKNKEKKWAIGIQDPFSAESRGKSIGYVNVEDKAVISSGPYERNFTENGKIYHHILNPFTGYPVENEVESVSIICSSGIDGDALSTTMFSLGIEKGLSLAETLKDTEVIFINSRKEVYMTSGTKEMYTHLDAAYKLMN